MISATGLDRYRWKKWAMADLNRRHPACKAGLFPFDYNGLGIINVVEGLQTGTVRALTGDGQGFFIWGR